MIKIQFLNLSTKLSMPDAQTIVAALALQVTRDFAPVWGIGANLYLAPAGQTVPTPGYWVIGFFDTADVAGALGYHDVTSEGLPLGKVFVETTLNDGALVSVTASHELLEMLGDPDVNLTAESDDAKGRPAKFWAYEMCDACEDDSFGYSVTTKHGTVTVSDFVYPAYFETFRAAGTQFDFGGHITAPLQILPGGYMGVLDLANLSKGWQQITADLAGEKKAQRIGSRRERRSLPHSLRVVSDYGAGKL